MSELNIFEISPFKFNVKVGTEKWENMWLKYDPDSEIFPEVFDKSELRKGLFTPKVTTDLDTPRKRTELLISVLRDDNQQSHCYYSN